MSARCESPSGHCVNHGACNENDGCMYAGRVPSPPPDTAVRLTAREVAHATGFTGVCFTDDEVGQGERQHGDQCDRLTAAIEERDRSHTDELREAVELLERCRRFLSAARVRHGCDTSGACGFCQDATLILKGLDERARKGQP